MYSCTITTTAEIANLYKMSAFHNEGAVNVGLNPVFGRNVCFCNFSIEGRACSEPERRRTNG